MAPLRPSPAAAPAATQGSVHTLVSLLSYLLRRYLKVSGLIHSKGEMLHLLSVLSMAEGGVDCLALSPCLLDPLLSPVYLPFRPFTCPYTYTGGLYRAIDCTLNAPRPQAAQAAGILASPSYMSCLGPKGSDCVFNPHMQALRTSHQPLAD